ncbi:microcephalin [Tachysurus vachellii]|uniref:microcephalin n=1 Tax=Tachysurus vachellii TaxID=175792 RepID=UPI00296AF24D|nr:microcephalin [Tachysurus vachellii]XP_060727831.1 microcephalin [Tachysurus vachellii]
MTSKKVPVAVLKDVVAYVDVWSASKTENYSDPFIQQLRDMGAQVCKTFNKQVTHVVFKHGHQATWDKAKKIGVKIVSVHWVARCKEKCEHADEDLYPAHNEESQLSRLKKRTHRCMQPRDIPQCTPKRLKRKLDKMMEDLVRSSPIVTDTETSPFIIDEENGIVYSPSSRRADTMAQRLREMRAQRENLSPTASQMQGSPTDDSIRPSLGGTPTDLNILLLEEEEALDCLSRSSICSSNKKVVKECHKKISLKKKTDRCVEKSPPDLDTGMRFSSSGVEETVKVLPPQNKRRSKSCSGAPKQASIDSYVNTVSSKKSASPLLTEPKAGATAKPTQSVGNKKKSYISSSPSSMETGENQIPRSTKEIKTNSDSGDFDSKRLPTFASPVCSAKSNEPNFQKAYYKKKQVDISGSAGSFDAHNDNADGSVFEDYFTSENDAPKRKVHLMHSVSESDRLPSFDLEPLKKSRRKSQIQENCSQHRKSKTLNERGIMEASGPPEEELPAVCMGASLPVPKESKLEQEPAAKKQRRRTRQNSVTLSESTHSKSTSDGLTDRCTELCSDMNTKRIVKMDKYMKKNRTLVMTSMPTEKQQTVIQVVNSLGGFTVVDAVCESTTHVVSGSPRRTLNILLGIARGCWILSFEWILWCLEHRQWVPEEPYELSDHFPAAPICRLQQHLSAGEHQQDLFREQPLMFVSSLSQPPCHSLTELLQLCGGTVCRSVRQAGICIGKYNGKRPEGTKCLSEQWVLDCVTHHLLLPYDNYILE